MGKIKITAIADLHGHFPVLKGGDLLIVAGDLTAKHTEKEHFDFWRWACYQNFKKVIVIGGNHDEYLEEHPEALQDAGETLCYLKDSGTTFEGLKIWGTPWSLWFDGINPRCKAFTGSESDLAKHFEKIPDDTDILISHGPFAACNDRSTRGKCLGSNAMRDAVERVKPPLFICGHIHEAYGYTLYKHAGPNTRCYNVAIMDELYRPVNTPVEIEVETK